MSDSRIVKTRFQYYHLANAVLFGNLIAGLIGDQMGTTFFMHRYMPGEEPPEALLKLIYDYITYIAVILTVLATLWYEHPIRRCLKTYYRGGTPPAELLERARRRVLNEPLVLTLLEALIWGGSSLAFYVMGSEGGFGVGVACGLITVILAFFWMEHMNQHHLIPVFFADHPPSQVKGAVKIRLWGRFIALIFSVCVVPLIFIQVTIQWYQYFLSLPEADPVTLFYRLADAITTESLFFLFTGLGLAWFMVLNFKRLLNDIIRVLEAVKKGNYGERAMVLTTDEVGYAGERLNAMTQGLAEREIIKDRFGKYVDRRIRDEILSGKIPLDGELKQATILFADLRNFTPLVAVSDPKELIHVINAYFNEMAQAIEAHGGLILQFIGDEVEAVFGAPAPLENHETAAVKAALEMRARLAALNQRFEAQDIAPLEHGIGIHTGQVLAATIGAADRAAYSLLGDTVNLASRIQGLNKEFKTDILVSRRVADALVQTFPLRAMPEVRVKGKTDPVQVYALDGPGHP